MNFDRPFFYLNISHDDKFADESKTSYLKVIKTISQARPNFSQPFETESAERAKIPLILKTCKLCIFFLATFEVMSRKYYWNRKGNINYAFAQ